LTNSELLAFSNYLITKDPTYPAKTATELYKPSIHGMKKDFPKAIFSILKNPEPMLRLYQEYKKGSGK
jgi:hypothetical protein